MNDHTCVCYSISKSSVVSQDQIGALLTKFQYAIDIPDGPVWEAMNYASNHGSGWVPRFDETDPPATRRQFTYQKSSEKYTKTQTSTQELPRNYPGTTQECSDQFFKHCDQFFKHYDSVMLKELGG